MNEFVKKHGASLLFDWQRLRALKQICDQLDGVTTPAALRIEAQTTTIAYEHYNFPIPLINQIKNPEIYWHVGRTLARMHQIQFSIDMEGFNSAPYPLQSLGIKQKDATIIEKNLPTGWFHGDFWHGNVFVLPNKEVIVVDPLPNSFIFPHTHIRASGGVDVAFMYMSIIFCLPLLDQITVDLNKHINAANSFLDGYLYEKGASHPHIAQSVRHASRALAVKFIKSYPYRLPYPTALAKKIAALSILHLVDKKLYWKN